MLKKIVIITLTILLILTFIKIIINPKNEFSQSFPFINTRFANDNNISMFSDYYIGKSRKDIHNIIGNPIDTYKFPKFIGEDTIFNCIKIDSIEQYSEKANNYPFQYKYCIISLYFKNDTLINISNNWFND